MSFDTDDQGRPDGTPGNTADRDGMVQAMTALMDRVREDVLAQERLLAEDPQAGERAARLHVLLNEARRRLENIEKTGQAAPGAPSGTP